MRAARNSWHSAPTADGWGRALVYVAAIVVGALAPSLPGQERELLNSERIARQFGSYGVEVLEQDASVRVSSLFSRAGAERVCRTFAVVRYAPHIDAVISAEHEQIVAGGSIGAVFAANGWEVRKTHLHYGERAARSTLAALMHVDASTPLAEHVYVLDVVKQGRTIEYAALVEIHHPDYLSAADLARIYGTVNEAERPGLAAALIELASQRIR